MSDPQQRYYLVIRPISEVPAIVESRLDDLAAITNIDRADLKQKFTGSALCILTSGKDRALLEKISRELNRQEHVVSSVVGSGEIRERVRPLIARKIEIDGRVVRLLSSDSNVLLKLVGKDNCLVVVGTMDYKRVWRKRLAYKVHNKNNEFPLERALQLILRLRPVIDIYAAGLARPVRIDSTRFHYKSLGEEMKSSRAQNFAFILKSICRASNALVDTGFGETKLPFIDTSTSKRREDCLRDFSRYSRFVYLACAGGLFKKPRKRALPTIPGIGDLGTILLGGPVLDRADAAALYPKYAPAADEPALAPSPIEPTVSGATLFNPIGAARYRRALKALGPPLLTYPLTFTAAGSLVLAEALESYAPLAMSALAAGLLLLTHSYTLIRRKRIIENTPTAKLRSMPMGEVEVKGRARAKYLVKAPYSFIDCVYYSYEKYRTVQTSDGYSRRFVKRGSSGPVPFYLEDDNNRVLVMPGGAILKVNYRETIRGGGSMFILAAARPLPSGMTVVETIIPVGARLYVTGFAHRVLMSTEAKKRTFTERLRALKADRASLMHFDINDDNRISADEWDLARKDVMERMLEERLSGALVADDVAIGEHPSGGLFYISDRAEEHILGSMAWRIPLFLILGTIGTVFGAGYMLQIWPEIAILFDKLFG